MKEWGEGSGVRIFVTSEAGDEPKFLSNGAGDGSGVRHVFVTSG